jgi:hypothetical protein
VPALFIVSTGRTGTTWIADVLATAGARAYHEPAPRWLRLVANAHAAGLLPADRATAIVQRARREVIGCSTVPYAEANSLLAGLVRPLLEAFPDAVVVQIVRDPRTYVRSALDWGQYRFAGRVLNAVPFRRLAAPQFRPWSLRARLDWARRDQFERLCWTWTAQNAAMRTQGSGDERFRAIRFEDLVDPARGPALLSSLVTSLGLPEPPAWVLGGAVERPRNESASRRARRDRRVGWARGPGRDGAALVAARSERLVELCGDEAAEYGYDLGAGARGEPARNYGAPRARGFAHR